MADTSALEPGTLVNARYRVESKIGQGGMGAVYLVRHVHTDEQLAMKVLHPQVLRNEEAVARFRREARAPAKIASEHVARVTDADTAKDLDDAPFYVMEYLRGEDLEHVLESKGPIPPPLVVEYLVQTARALDKAHPLGIVHRDLKPENLFLTTREDGSPCIKLLDFGIARLGDTDAPNQMKTAEGFVFGTPSFMSPEQTTGSVDLIGPGTDIWALGLLTFKLLTKVDFWDAQNLQQLYAKILQLPIPTPTERGATFGPAFDAWFARCVAREVTARWKTAGEAAAALADALGVRIERRPSSVSLVSAAPYVPSVDPASHLQTSAAPPATSVAPVVPVGVEPAPTGSSSRTKILAAVGAGVAALALVGVVFALVDRSTRPSVAPARIVSNAQASSASAASTETAAPPPATPTAEPAPSVLPANATATPVVETPTVAAPSKGRGTATPAGKGGGSSAKDPSPSPPTGGGAAALSSDQRRRLEALQRMCDQGTFTAAECATKRAGILRGDK
ncbi:MAG: protein kinase [Deltaproteobacteria bacterium]|nr:protein kinase [Deltaproteobacteria bacterium]